ncbi:MAG: hypothetical protein HZC36_16185 [Armatimonadetes bacterium]|nr:hypothetical protein [Armatimonadota bacterium]
MLVIPGEAHGADILQWFKREILDKIQVSGRRTLGYHQHTVEGDRDAFDLLNYFGEGNKTFTDNGYMTVAGNKVLGSMSFQSTINTNRFKDPQSQDFTLTLDKKPFKILAGDVHGSLLNTNRFAAFNKFLKGTVAEYRQGPFQMRALYTQAKGSARTVTLQGNNSSGPYYLSFSQIVKGSETVLVDGQPMELLKDYVISYETGAITFIERIIAPTSTITISFEAFTLGRATGTIQGASASYNFGRYGTLGLTAIEQRTGASSTLSSRTELFQGAGDASTPYYLQFEPLDPHAVVVKVDGILQTEGADYNFDSQNKTVFFFTRFISLSSTISATYVPKPTQALDGDRKVWGFDYRLPIGNGKNSGSIRYSQATGRLESPVSPLEGTARGVDLNYQLNDWTLTSSVRDVPSTFVSVESRGFNRNEKAADIGAAYKGSGPWKLDFRNANSAVSIRTTDSNGDLKFTTARSTSFTAGADYLQTAGQPWNLEYRRTRSRSTGTDSKTDGLELGTSRTFGRLITNWGFEALQAEGPTTFNNVVSNRKIGLQTLRAKTSYTAGEAWAFGLDASVSSIKSGSESGVGSDVMARAGYTPSERQSVVLDYTVSDSGKLATLGGFTNGLGLGYGGNGFSGGYNGQPYSLGNTNVRRLHLGTTYRPTERINLRADYVQSRNIGSITSNSDTTFYLAGATAQLDKNHFFDLDFSQSKTRYAGSNTRSNATNVSAEFRGDRIGPWSYRLGVNSLLTGGNSLYKQNGTHFDANLTYQLNDKQSLALDFLDGQTNGYSGQSESYAALSYRYQIWRSIALIGGYKVREVRNLDTASTSGAYRSRGFDIELSFTFGG